MILGAHLLDKALNHELGCLEVGNHAVAQRTNCGNAHVGFAMHLARLLAHLYQFLGF